jgi:predicted phage-related endonuclease
LGLPHRAAPEAYAEGAAAVTEAAAALRELSEPWARGDRVKAAIERAARRAGLTYWRAFDIWYGKARRIEPHEIEAIETALSKRRKEVMRNEVAELRSRIARLEALLAQKDADFDRQDDARLRASAGGLGGMDCALAKRKK